MWLSLKLQITHERLSQGYSNQSKLQQGSSVTPLFFNLVSADGGDRPK